MAETSISLAGNRTSDPELHHSPSGIARATFRVAMSSRVRDGEGWRDGEPAFYAVVVWRDQAVHAAESLSKGSRVVVVGQLAQRTWQADDGTSRSVVEVVAEELGPSLRWATATTTRATRSTETANNDHPSRAAVRLLTSAPPCGVPRHRHDRRRPTRDRYGLRHHMS